MSTHEKKEKEHDKCPESKEQEEIVVKPFGDPPHTCPPGQIWNGKKCIDDVG